MSRNSSGVYTLPIGNPVVTGTTITSSWANTTASDIGSEITNSLDRSGRGGMLAALKNFDGTIAAPGVTFSNETTTGMSRPAAGNLSFSILGTLVAAITAAGLSIPLGAAATPGLTFTGDPNTGIWSPGADIFAVSTAGAERMRIAAAGNVTIAAPSSGPTLTISNLASTDSVRVRGVAGASGNLVLQADGGLGSAFWVTATTTILKIGGTGGSEPGTGFLQITNIGNVSIAAPSSGIALSLDGQVANAVQLNFGQGAGTGFYVQHRNGPASAGLDGDLVQETTLEYTGGTRNTAIQWRRGGSTVGGFLDFTAGSDRLMLRVRDTGVAIFAPASGNSLAVIQVAGTANDGIRITSAAGAGNYASLTLLAQGVAEFSIRTDTTTGNLTFRDVTNSRDRMAISPGGNTTIDASTGSGIGLAVSALGGPGIDVLLNNETFGRVLNGRNQSAGGANQAQILHSAGDVWFGNDRAGETVLFTAATRRLTIGSVGVVTVAAPSSGNSLIVSGAAGSDTALFNGGTSGSFRVTDRGLPYGTSIHNNAGAVTGATNQYIASGTYTPTLTNVTNIGASTARQCQWMRVGNVVTVSGQFDYTCTAGTTNSEVGISLPIASAFTTQYQLGGSGGNYEAGVNSGGDLPFDADATNDRARCRFVSTRITGQTNMFTFMYEVL